MDILNEALAEFEREGRPCNCRYFKIAGINVRVESDLDFSRIKFKKKFDSFAVDGPGSDNVVLKHYFGLPDLKGQDLGEQLYRRVPWAVYRKGKTWIYLGILPEQSSGGIYKVGVFNESYDRGIIYNKLSDKENVCSEGWSSLSLFPTDQIWLAPLLADREAFFIHSSAVILNGQGEVFVGHSDAGKSTTLKMLKGHAEILCDDRNILRRWKDGWRVHGTWSHGELPYVSPLSAPLRAVLFLRQDTCNRIVPLNDRLEIWKRLLATLIKPMVTVSWWHKEMDTIEKLIRQVPFYTMHFDRSGGIVKQLENLAKKGRDIL